MNDQIGPYRVEGELGRGGMGVVYRATDTRLDRVVAIKALPEELASDAGRLERFEREAKTLASLNHPNVAGILGIEEAEGAKYLILEFVDGETLADRLDRGPLAVDEAIELAVQIAAGVEAAHEAGVIHRDLKPANIKITPEGQAKVLDFGLAKVEEGNTSGSSLSQMPTQTSPAKSPTMEGAILGTAAYMSPEQARGRKVDKRSDIWSFGVVLFEMLCGASPFVGETATDSIGAILHKNLDLALLPKGTPSGVRRVLSRCVERDKSQRYRDIGDVRVELLRAKDEPAEVAVATGGGAGGVGGVGLVLVALLVLVVGAAAWFGAVLTRPEAARVVSKVDLVVGTDDERLDDVGPRISPDGRRVAYLADGLIQLRDLDTFSSRALSGTEGAVSLFWSPGGEWIGYAVPNAIYKVRVSGGGAIKVCDTEGSNGAIATGGWTADDRIVWRGEHALFEVPARGGEPSVLLANGADEVDFHQVRAVNGTSMVVFVTHLSTLIGQRVEAFDGERRVVIAETNENQFTSLTYSPTGHVLYSRGFAEPTLWAVGFDADSMAVTGEPFQIMDGSTQPSVSNNGTLAVKRGSALAMGGSLMWLDGADESFEPLGVGGDLDVLQIGAVSPNGRMVALTAGEPTRSDVWLLDLERGSTSRLTFGETYVSVVGWSPDSTEIAVVVFEPSAEIGSIETTFLAADGSGESRDPVPGIVMGLDRDWSLAMSQNDFRDPEQVVTLLSLDGSSEPKVVFSSDSGSFVGAPSGGGLSPNGDLILITEWNSGKAEIFCTRVDGGRGRYQVSTDGGTAGRWSPDGKWVYFGKREESKLYRVAVEREMTEDGSGLAAVRFGMPEEVMDAAGLDLNFLGDWAFGPNSKYLVLKNAEGQEQERASLSVVTNWFDEFREK